MMEWLLWTLAVAVLGVAAVVASGRLGGMPDAVADTPPLDLPEEPLTAADVRDTRFTSVWQGYSPAQVDALLARVADQLETAAAAGPVESGAEEAAAPQVE